MHIKTTRVTSQNYWLPPPPCHKSGEPIPCQGLMSLMDDPYVVGNTYSNTS